MRDFNQVPKSSNIKVSEKELELGIGWIDRLTSEEFHSANYEDEYRIRVVGGGG
jgi:non-homologous end joining protein Ku